MLQDLPPLVNLPSTVPETEVWPQLAEIVGDDGVGLDARTRRWLTIATQHRSGLYESSELSSFVSPVCLSLLENVGSTVLELERRLAIEVHADRWDVPRLFEEQVRLGAPTRAALVDTLGVVDHAHLGAGERQQAEMRGGRSGQPIRTYESVALQVLGWWSLVSPGKCIRRFIWNLHASSKASAPSRSDWRTVFEQNFQHLAPAFVISEHGPDHLRVFEARVTIRDGRTATGSATRKKEAEQRARQAFLNAHAPHLIAPSGGFTSGPSGAARRRSSLPVRDEHRRVARAFRCEDARLFTKALTHRSWVYENAPGANPKLDSNAILCHIGSSVVDACFARTRARSLLGRGTDPDPVVASALGLSDQDLGPLGESLDLVSAALLGVGAARDVSEEMVANFVQGVFAAAFMNASGLADFERGLPADVSRFLLEQARRSRRDPATVLQILASELQFEVTERDHASGPGHQLVYRNSTTISGDGESIVVRGSGPTKRAARKDAAESAVRADRLRQGEPCGDARPDLAWFLLHRQLWRLNSARSRWPRWHQQNVLGAALLMNRSGFASWTREVLRCAPQHLDLPAALVQTLGEYYADAAPSAITRPLFADTLGRVLQWVLDAAGGDERSILDPQLWSKLLDLSAAQSVWLTPLGTADVTDTIKDWALLNRRRLEVRVEADDRVPVEGRTGAALQRVLQEYAQADAGADGALTVSVNQGITTHIIRLSPRHGWIPGAIDSLFVELLSEASTHITVNQVGDDLTVEVGAATEEAPYGWLGAAATCTQAISDSDIEIARLVHDLKNEVTAARISLSAEASTRTHRLENELAASRHLESAAVIATQLVDAKMLYDVATAGTCEISAFLRRYAGDLIKRLPETVRVIPAEHARAEVAVAESVLRGVLDNLVKNAVEAMPGGGEIAFDHTPMPEDGIALLECRDTGQGVPEQVVRSVRAGVPATSGKRQGSGLGLQGVMRALRRIGGKLEPLRTEVGGGWLLVLPLVTGPTDGEQTR